MKRLWCLIVVLAVVASQAQNTQRMLKIYYQHNGSTDTTLLSILDSATVENNRTDLVLHLNTGSVKTFAVDQVDSMFWPYKDGPAYHITQPTAGQIFHVGDTLTVTWDYNPSHAGTKAYLQMYTSGVASWKWLTYSDCYMLYKDSTKAGTLCSGSTNYVAWPYTVVNGKYVGTYKFRIANPTTFPDPSAAAFDPTSDSVIIKIHDYVNAEQDVTPVFSIKP